MKEVLQYMNEKHHKLFMFLLYTVIIGVFSLVLFGIDSVQKARREKTVIVTAIEENNTDGIPVYNVEGVSDEEIERILEEQRRRDGITIPE